MRRGKVITAIVLGMAVLAGVAVYAFRRPADYHTPAYNMRFKIPIYAESVQNYREARGRYPTTEEGLEQLVREGMLRQVPRDDWGNALVYRYPTERKDVPFELCTLGEDGKLGGEGTNADICNWKR